jgi:sugar fermentation stimulation protein A
MKLIKGTLIKRYKRFLADIELDDGTLITAHCPNTGSMKRCAEPGWTVWVSVSDNPKRKYAHTWEYVLIDHLHLACINTQRPNRMVENLLEQGRMPELAHYKTLKREVKYGELNDKGKPSSRIDLMLTQAGEPDCYVEVKSVTLLENDGFGYFPDSKTERGQKHLRELMLMKAQGFRAVLFFCVSHTGIDNVQAAAHIDPVYAQLLDEAKIAGVEVYAWQMSDELGAFELSHQISVL